MGWTFVKFPSLNFLIFISSQVWALICELDERHHFWREINYSRETDAGWTLIRYYLRINRIITLSLCCVTNLWVESLCARGCCGVIVLLADFKGPIGGTGGWYVHTLMDAYSKYPFSYITKSTSNKTRVMLGIGTNIFDN